MTSQRVYSFLVVLLLMFPAKIFSQQQMPRSGQNSPHLLIKSTRFQRSSIGIHQYDKTTSTSFDRLANLKQEFFSERIKYQVIQPGYYSDHLGFFCQKEMQFEKRTNIPLRMRLGSLHYVDGMEGKSIHVRPAISCF